MDEQTERLQQALAKLTEAQELIAQEWRENVKVRTPRMADCVSLLDRGAQKLKKECQP